MCPEWILEGWRIREIPATMKQVQFDATLKYNESHQLYRPVTEPAYVGEPTPEIDAAWKDLLGAINVFVTPKEESQLGGGLWLDPETGLHMAQ
ncbi:hypothetical protein EYZ11_013379 [Aspergillus tanneri]|uniref:Uncharacterized protein n=1 Tax=Aspergillus tanneri TaxID=1220188 RepID=A0A4S3IY25_9EURO|nr:hypothetical protein EYZ11_013379 [Aspergillus tanneri]